ncbi:MAG: hypothetical protein C4520_21335 [Candidatus Abyssobacteria bacterium SURF_5]|uniref:Xcc1710-like domain-containing protein n=1 Tax=Abyssobacteria bacterium (strain SURF_5) TaxID=2093360 RepID=A0A3A4NIK5_ABYX5|nr:MAG: hypothetical protein C4520_21335 [Candidatus Abyssubacteria bacterium SURF_5]
MALIDRYSFGSVTIGGRSYASDLIIYPDKIQEEWWRKEGHRLQTEDIPDVLADPPEILVIGQGDPGRMQIDPRVTEALKQLNVRVLAAPTKKACEEFNRLVEQGKKVIAALHLTC